MCTLHCSYLLTNYCMICFPLLYVGSGTVSKKKSPNVGWIETDLDLGGSASPAAEEVGSAQEQNFSPLYVNTNNGDKQNCKCPNSSILSNLSNFVRFEIIVYLHSM